MQVPFPHILTQPKQSNEYLFRFVTDEQVNGRVTEKVRTQHNPKTEVKESVYEVYCIDEVIESRRAKGDWSNWAQHPIYYKTRGKFLGEQFQSNLGTNDFINKTN